MASSTQEKNKAKSQAISNENEGGMQMAEKSDKVSMPDERNVSFGNSQNSLVTNDGNKKVSNDLWWKITITIVVLILVVFIVYKAVDDSKKSSEEISNSSSNQMPNSQEESKEYDCTEGSLDNSRASFTFQPYHSNEPYTTHGLEFSFEEVKNKPGVETGMTELDPVLAATSKIHYYYNIARCEIGGGVQTDKKPYIRGPIVFAMDQLCVKVYYFTEGNGWTQYRSARNMNCSSHGNKEIKVEKSKCLEGSVNNSNASFVYLPFGAIEPYQASGIEFSFGSLAKKTKLGSRLTPLSKLLASTSDVYYYYNIARCEIGGGLQTDKKPYTRGPIVFAMDQQCSKVYYFTEGKGWTQYRSARNIECSNQENINKTKCFKNSLEGSYLTFKFTSITLHSVEVTAIQFNFTKLVEKLKDLETSYDLTRIPEAPQNFSYYLNLHRCYNGGLTDPTANPPIGGALILAVGENCSNVYYLSTTKNYQWRAYRSATEIKCTKRYV